MEKLMRSSRKEVVERPTSPTTMVRLPTIPRVTGLQMTSQTVYQELPVVAKIQVYVPKVLRGSDVCNAVPRNDNKPGEQSRSRNRVIQGLRGKQVCNTAHSNGNKTAKQSHLMVTQEAV